MFPTIISASTNLPLNSVIERLSRAPQVAGLALFGSSAQPLKSAVSDYDLLVMLDEPPIPIFQMQTYIDGRIADVAFVETKTARQVLALTEPVGPTSPEGFLIGWLEQAQVIYDRNDWFRRIQGKVATRDWRIAQSTQADIYSEWFWWNFDLRHNQRMSRSDDPIHLMTVDLRLAACMAGICRTYYRLHGLHWRGEKAALRYLQTHDIETFTLLSEFMKELDRTRKVDLCAHLLQRVLASSGGLWPEKTTALFLKIYQDHPTRVEEALTFWEGLLIE